MILGHTFRLLNFVYDDGDNKHHRLLLAPYCAKDHIKHSTWTDLTEQHYIGLPDITHKNIGRPGNLNYEQISSFFLTVSVPHATLRTYIKRYLLFIWNLTVSPVFHLATLTLWDMYEYSHCADEETDSKKLSYLPKSAKLLGNMWV